MFTPLLSSSLLFSPLLLSFLLSSSLSSSLLWSSPLSALSSSPLFSLLPLFLASPLLYYFFPCSLPSPQKEKKKKHSQYNYMCKSSSCQTSLCSPLHFLRRKLKNSVILAFSPPSVLPSGGAAGGLLLDLFHTAQLSDIPFFFSGYFSDREARGQVCRAETWHKSHRQVGQISLCRTSAPLPLSGSHSHFNKSRHTQSHTCT